MRCRCYICGKEWGCASISGRQIRIIEVVCPECRKKLEKQWWELVRKIKGGDISE